MRRIALFAAASAMSLAIAGCSSSSDSDSGSDGQMWSGAPLTTKQMSDADKKQIDAAAQDALKEAEGTGATGMWIGIWHPEKGMYTFAVGDAAKGGPKATLKDHGRIGSLTKTFTATGILQQVAAGKLALDDTIADVLPDFAEKFPEIKDVTIEQLLNMTAGIPDYSNSGLIMADVVTKTDKVWTVDEIVERVVKELGVNQETQTYSTTDYLILGEILGKVTGKSPHEAVTDVATGLDMKNTALPAPDDSKMPDPAITGYWGSGVIEQLAALGAKDVKAGPAPINPASWGGTGGGMYSIVDDLGTWAGSGLGTSTLPEDLGEQRLNDVDNLADAGCYGLGIQNFGSGWIGHSGQTTAFETQVMYNTETGAAFVGMVNEGGSLGSVYKIQGLVFDKEFTEKPPVSPCDADSSSADTGSDSEASTAPDSTSSTEPESSASTETPQQ